MVKTVLSEKIGSQSSIAHREDMFAKEPITIGEVILSKAVRYGDASRFFRQV